MQIKLFFTALLLVPLWLHAQDKNDTGSKEEKVPVFNYSIDDPMDKFQPRTDTERIIYTAPEFYFHRAHEHRDTTFQYFCYDSRDSLIRHVSNYDSVYYYSLYRNYPDPVHTYKDYSGVERPLIVSSIIRRFDRLGNDKWREVNYLNNKYYEFTANRKKITNSDSVVLYDPNTGKVVKHVYQYYKVKR